MMKKLMAVLLACTMMMGLSMVASADLYGDLYPGEEYVIKAGVQVDGEYEPGKEYKKASIDRSNFKITDIEWEEGSGLVEYVRITDDGLVLKVKPRNSAVSRDIIGTVTIEARGDTVKTGLSKGDEFEFEINATVTFDEENINRGDTVKSDSNEYYHAREGGWVDFTSAYADVHAYVLRDEDYYVYCNNDPIAEILNLYPEAKEHAKFVNFPGKPSFPEAATVRIKADEEGYLYKVSDGKLVSMEAIWFPNGNSGWEFSTSKLGSYVWSDVKLTASSGSTAGSAPAGSSSQNTAKNPDTGSIDRIMRLALEILLEK